MSYVFGFGRVEMRCFWLVGVGMFALCVDHPIAWHYACGEIMLADDATHSDWVVWFGGSLAFLVSSGTVWFWSVGSYFGVLLSHVSGSGCD